MSLFFFKSSSIPFCGTFFLYFDASLNFLILGFENLPRLIGFDILPENKDVLNPVASGLNKSSFEAYHGSLVKVLSISGWLS